MIQINILQVGLIIYFFLNGFIARDVYESCDKYRFLKLIGNAFFGLPFLISICIYYFLKVATEYTFSPLFFFFDFYFTNKYKSKNLDKWKERKQDLISWRNRSRSKIGRKQFELIIKRIENL